MFCIYVLVIYAILATVFAIIKHISLLAILLYYAEQGHKLPDEAQQQKYVLKVVKKMLHIPS